MINYIQIKIKNLPRDFWIIVITTFIVGMIAHGFCYTNMFPEHDGAALYWKMNIPNGAAGSRWLSPVIDYLLNSVQMPWLDGILTLFLYALSSWLVCRVLDVKNEFLQFVIAGTMVTSPTTIASNHFLSSAPSYALALLMACLAVWAMENWKGGVIWASLLMFVLCSIYASYISMAASLFIINAIRKLLEGDSTKFFDNLFLHIKMLISIAIAMLSDIVVCKVIVDMSLIEIQNRVDIAMGYTIGDYVEKINDARKIVIDFFSVNSNVSFFHGIPILFFAFWILFSISIIIAFTLLYRNKVYRNVRNVMLMLIDVYILPITMNILGIITDIHYLMTFAYIIPFIFCIKIFEIFFWDMKSNIQRKNRLTNKLRKVYELIIIASSFIIMTEGCKIANISYTKAYGNYVAGIELTNRIVDHIEGIDEYIPGTTKVIFVGSLSEYYMPDKDGYFVLDDLTGINFNTALTYNFPLCKYIEQHLGVKMNIQNPLGEVDRSINRCKEVLDRLGIYYSEQLDNNILSLDPFPKNKCYIWLDEGNILIYKLGNTNM